MFVMVVLSSDTDPRLVNHLVRVYRSIEGVLLTYQE